MKLKDFFLNENHRPINKWLHYFEIYERHFEKYVGKDVTVVEIGVAGGGSLQMWKHYFGPKARIIGVDKGRDTVFKEDQIEVRAFDQSSKPDLERLPDPDIVIDDGAHRYKYQLASFESLYPRTKGVYLIEDTHTAYWSSYHTGETIISHAKQNIDRLHSWHTELEDFAIITKSMHFYDSVVVYEKGVVEKPQSMVK